MNRYQQRTAARNAKFAKIRAQREFKRGGGVFGAICRFIALGH